MTNINDFIKAKEEELDGLGDIYTFPHNSCTYVRGYKPEENGSSIPLDGRNDTEVIKNLLSQSLLEYNEKIKEMCEKKNGLNGENLPFENSPEIYGNQRIESYKKGYNQALDDIITNLTQDTNPKE